MLVVLRQTRYNRFTLPLLANLVETWDAGRRVSIAVARGLEEVLRALREDSPVLLGYSFMTPQLGEVSDELRLIVPYLRPHDLVVAGGAHPTADPQGTLALGFQAVVVGEGEEVFPRLLGQWARGERGENTIPVWRASSPCCLDVALPISSRLNWMAPVEISRGCPHACGYCFTPRIYPPPVRHRGLGSIRHYLEESGRMGRTAVRFIAPDAFSYREPGRGGSPGDSLVRLLRACRASGIRKVHLGSFPSEVRPEGVTDESLELISTYCTNRTLVIGAQSGSDRLLRSLNRGHTAADAEMAVRRVVAAGLLAHVDMIFGTPGETPEDRLESLRFMERLIALGRTRIHAHIYLPLPGTPLFAVEPPAVEPWFLERLRALQGSGFLDGQWEGQLMVQQQILSWRRTGMIRV